MDFEKRARELVGQMTLEEKASQLRFDAPAIGHLGIPRYHWWNEGLHGVARAGTATMFPLWWGRRPEPNIMHMRPRRTGTSTKDLPYGLPM